MGDAVNAGLTSHRAMSWFSAPGAGGPSPAAWNDGPRGGGCGAASDATPRSPRPAGRSTGVSVVGSRTPGAEKLADASRCSDTVNDAARTSGDTASFVAANNSGLKKYVNADATE